MPALQDLIYKKNPDGVAVLKFNNHKTMNALTLAAREESIGCLMGYGMMMKARFYV